MDNFVFLYIVFRAPLNTYKLHEMPLNVITLEQRESDNINPIENNKRPLNNTKYIIVSY